MEVWGHLSLLIWYLFIFCGQSLEVFALYEIHVILFLYWKLFFELFTISVFWRCYLFHALVQSESPLQYMNIFYILYWGPSFWLCYTSMYDISYFVGFLCFYMSLKKKNRNRCLTTVNLWLLCLNSKEVSYLSSIHTAQRKGALSTYYLFVCLSNQKNKNPEISQHLFHRLKMKFLNSLHTLMN